MKTNWDYTNLANAYLKRPDYALSAIVAMLKYADISKDSIACDIGAGTAHLTKILANYVKEVYAIEPNDNMRNNGIKVTQNIPNIHWFDGIGEDTKQKDNFFDIVTFGSSFNVCDRQLALKESHRILKPGGYFACMWNHRKLDDPIQENIENIIKNHIPNYDYGTRREDQTNIITSSLLFSNLVRIESDIIHVQTIEETIDAWKSHGTLARQAGDKFNIIIDEIANYLYTLNSNFIEIPYTTKIWIAKVIK